MRLLPLLLVWALALSAAECRGRHRRVPRPNPNPNPDPAPQELPIFRSTEGQIQNKFKPEFTGCERWRPEVEEEAKRGKKRNISGS